MGKGVNVQVAVSDDYKVWRTVKAADSTHFEDLPVLSKWARHDDKLTVWAPDIVKTDDGTWVMYVAIGIGSVSKHCIAVATSKKI